MKHPIKSDGHFIDRPTRLVAVLGLSLMASLTAQKVGAQDGNRGGKEVVDTVCAACHRTGVNGAPKIGDKQAWAKLASQGLTALTEHALKGIRKMPAHGGNQALSDGEIERAITYMVNQSGGRWAEPVSRATAAAERSGKQIVQMQCAKCHETGAGGAPKIGDPAAWRPHLKQGLEVAVRSAIKGHGPMPARGGLADLTDSEMRSAIVYMVNRGSAQAPGAPVALAPKSGPSHKIVDGTEVYLGIISAETIRAGHSKGDAESLMHGGIPSGRGYNHVNISLLNSKTRTAITDAQVTVVVTDPVMGSETKKLELMAVRDTISYGHWFRMPGKDPYTIIVRIRRPDRPRAIETRFDYRNQ